MEWLAHPQAVVLERDARERIDAIPKERFSGGQSSIDLVGDRSREGCGDCQEEREVWFSC
jgi:hypothetical protein